MIDYLMIGFCAIWVVGAAYFVLYTLIAPIRYHFTSWDPELWEWSRDFGKKQKQKTVAGAAIYCGKLIYGAAVVAVALIALGYATEVFLEVIA